jgi:hypothetical protein
MIEMAMRQQDGIDSFDIGGTVLVDLSGLIARALVEAHVEEDSQAADL